MWAPIMRCGARVDAKRPKYEMRRMPKRKSGRAPVLRRLRQRALADWGRGSRDAEGELRRLPALAWETQLGLAVPAIEQALAEA